jgi:uridine kinase
MIVCISGAKGAGKSTAADKIGAMLPNARIVHCDDFLPEYFTKSMDGVILDKSGVDWSKMRKYRAQPWAMIYKELGLWDKIKGEVSKYTQAQIDEMAETSADGILILEQASLPGFKNGIWNKADLRVVVEAGEKEHLKHCIIREKERADRNKEGDLQCYGNPDRQFDIKGRRRSFYKKFNEHTRPADYTLRHNYENDDSFDKGVLECVRLIMSVNEIQRQTAVITSFNEIISTKSKITAKNRELQIGGTVGL